MGFRAPLYRLHERPMLDAARVFDARNAVNRSRAELMDALRLLDGLAPSPTLHKLRLAVTQIDEVRDELKGHQ